MFLCRMPIKPGKCEAARANTQNAVCTHSTRSVLKRCVTHPELKLTRPLGLWGLWYLKDWSREIEESLKLDQHMPSGRGHPCR